MKIYCSNSNKYQDSDMSDYPFVINSRGVLTSYDGYFKHIIIPDGVRVINSNVFEHDYILEYVELPQSVQRIKEYAFQDTNLCRINIPYGISKIESGTFCNCDLEKIDLPDSIISIEEMAFSSNKRLKYINFPPSLKQINDSAFEMCAFVKLSLPPNVETVGQSAFYGCSNLQFLSIEGDVTIDKFAFEKCSTLESVIFYGNVTVQKGAFSRCSSLNRVQFNRASYIHEDAFTGTPILEDILDNPKVTTFR